jgi:Family of unknown function (DUF5995)
MAAQTIDGVVSALDTIIQEAYEHSSRLGYFAALYRRVTCAVRDGINSGRFQDCQLMEQLDVVFANRYLDALARFQAGGTPTRSWSVAFRGCDDPSRLVLQQLLSGMNAHINLDLGIASAQVCPGADLPRLKPDFDEINDVLAQFTGTVTAEIAAVSPLIGDLEKIGLRDETSLINFSIIAARHKAWIVAQGLASEAAALHELTMDGLDLAVSIEGRAILYPLIGREGLAIIQQAEVRDVRKVIDVLAAPGTTAQAAMTN